MNIKETALKVWDSNMIECPPENLTKFAEALVAELANENKPFAWYDGNKFYANEESASMACADMANLKPVFTSPHTAEQIEQETAKARKVLSTPFTPTALAELKAENESLKRDAEQWRAYQKRKQDLLDRGFLRSPLREEAELNHAMAKG